MKWVLTIDPTLPQAMAFVEFNSKAGKTLQILHPNDCIQGSFDIFEDFSTGYYKKLDAFNIQNQFQEPNKKTESIYK